MFDLNREKDSYYITMEYVPGEDLKSMIRMTKNLSVGTVISIGNRFVKALQRPTVWGLFTGT
jgi:serine/threonine-protein kinase